MVDRDRGNPRNILGVKVDWDEHDMYRNAVKAGILSTKYFQESVSGVTAAKARNSVRQTSASVMKQRDFVTADVTAVSVVKIRIS